MWVKQDEQDEQSGEHRLKEHRRGYSTPYYTTSAVAEHTLETNHEIDWSSAKVVDSSEKFHQRIYLEAWNIMPPALCLSPLGPRQNYLPMIRPVFHQFLLENSLGN